jgi:hypothetical protein
MPKSGGCEIARLEAVGQAGLDEQLLGPLGVVGVRLDWERELHVARHDVPREAGEAEGLRVVDGFTVDGETGGEADLGVVPG